MLNDQSNEPSRGTTLTSDPPLHDHLRQVVAHRLTPRALREQLNSMTRTYESLPVCVHTTVGR